jgi:hypothetical protein
LGFLGGFFYWQPCLVVGPGLLARDERVHRHHAGLVLRAHEHVLLIGLLQEQQHVTVCTRESESGIYMGQRTLKRHKTLNVVFIGHFCLRW